MLHYRYRSTAELPPEARLSDHTSTLPSGDTRSSVLLHKRRTSRVVGLSRDEPCGSMTYNIWCPIPSIFMNCQGRKQCCLTSFLSFTSRNQLCLLFVLERAMTCLLRRSA